MAKRVYVDEEECIGCGSCEAICPEVFQLDSGSGKAKVIKSPDGLEELIEEAIEACPVTCISWKE